MIITRKNYQKIIDTLKGDLGLEVRFTTRVVFINNLDCYKKMVADLSSMADEIVNISDNAFCVGEDSVPNLKKVLAHISESRDKNIVSVSFPNCDGEALLHRLDLKGIYISTGSACDSKRKEVSHVLKAIQLDEIYANGTVRISLSSLNSQEEVITIAQEIIKILRNNSAGSF